MSGANHDFWDSARMEPSMVCLRCGISYEGWWLKYGQYGKHGPNCQVGGWVT